MIHIRLPFKTPTVNHLYWHIKKTGVKVLTTEAKAIRKKIDDICNVYLEDADYYDNKPLHVSVTITEDWLNKDGSIKKKDIANREKFLIDSVFRSLCLDDRLIWVINIEKEQSETDEYAIIQICSIDEYNSIDSLPPPQNQEELIQ